MDPFYNLAGFLPYTHGKKRSLDVMNTLDACLGYPSRSFTSVLIGGTNGKGSVATKMAKSFELSSKKTGLYLSPHIESYCERISINGVTISEEEAIKEMKSILAKAAQLDLTLTFFEAMTLLAFSYFARHRIENAVLEVGMGGRLDATNIVTPLLSVITSIDFDHMEYLGSTKEEIAREKGGIIKPGIPVILGPEAREPILYSIAAESKSPLYEVTERYVNYEEENQAIARRALECLTISPRGILTTPPCRFEIIDPQPIILDVAHNPAGFRALLQRIAMTYPGKKFRALVAFSRGKEVEVILPLLKKTCAAVHLTTSPHPRLYKMEEYRVEGVMRNESLRESLDEVVRLAKENGEGVVIAGSFFIMAEVKQYFSV